MTNLTEQKGKKTHFYIKLPNSDVFIGDEFALSLYRNCKDGDKVEVLGEVPSYGELSSIKNDLTAANGLLKHEKEKNDQLKKWCEEFNALDVAKENTKLKELLKEWLLFEKEENPHDFTIMSERMEELAKQSKQVLGEE